MAEFFLSSTNYTSNSKTNLVRKNNQESIFLLFFGLTGISESFLYFAIVPVGQIYFSELQLNMMNSSDTEIPFLDFNLSITNGIFSSKIYDKRDDLILK